MRAVSSLSRLVAITFLLGLLAVPAQANVGRRSFPGTRTAEPGGLRDVAIVSEALRFDLRPLASRENGNVSASYDLDNKSAATVTMPLVFASGTSGGSIAVTFDGAPVASVSLSKEQIAALPPSWSAPVSTPSLGGGQPLGYETEGSAASQFTLSIPPGRHQLAVAYGATPQRNRSRDGGTLVYQLGYVLAPARDWGSFANLDITVDVPAGWRVATSPALARTGDTLRGTFPSLPADTIGITFQAPTGTLYAVLQVALPLLALFVLVGGGYAMWALGRARGRRSDVRNILPAALPASMGWGLAIAISGGYAAVRNSLAIPANQSAAYGYGGGFGIMLAVLVGLICIPIGVAIARSGRERALPT